MSEIPKRKSGSVDIGVRRWNAELQLYEDSINAVLHSDQANGDQCRSIQPPPQKRSLIRNSNILDLFWLDCICLGEAGLKPGGFEAGPRLPCRSITHCAPWDADARARKDPEAGSLPQGPSRNAVELTSPFLPRIGRTATTGHERPSRPVVRRPQDASKGPGPPIPTRNARIVRNHPLSQFIYNRVFISVPSHDRRKNNSNLQSSKVTSRIHLALSAEKRLPRLSEGI